MKILTVLFAFLLPFLSHSKTLAEQIETAFETVAEAERRGQGFYFGSDIFGDLGLNFGHQFSITDQIGLRLEAGHAFFGIDGEPAVNHISIHRYGGFLDLRLADTDSFIYLGSMFNKGEFASAWSFDSGIILRIQDTLAIKIGHAYHNFGEFDGAVIPRDHSLRIGVVHFFKRK